MNYVLKLHENMKLQNPKFNNVKIKKLNDRVLEIKSK